MHVFGLRKEGDLRVRRVVAIGTEVIGGDIAGGDCRRLAVPEVTSYGFAARAEGGPKMRTSFIGSGACVEWDERGVEVEVSGIEVSGGWVSAAFIERASVEDTEDLAGETVGNVGDELKGVVEGADDEAVVAMKSIN